MKRVISVLGLMGVCLNAAALEGVVIDKRGQAIEGAVVEWVEQGVSIDTDQQGRFSFDAERIDELHIEASGFAHKVVHLHGDDTQVDITLLRTSIEHVDVVGLPIHASMVESALPVVVLAGDTLRKQQADTLGDTLNGQVGVHSSSYGTVASSPVIRGLDGPRVKITQNSLDVADVSSIGPDHVVTAESATAEQVEILRGPATLFYGSGAIGGVVNVVDHRVPQDSDSEARFAASHNTVADANDVSGMVKGGTDRLALYVDAAWRENEEYEIPVPAEVGEDGDLVLANSQAETETFTVGSSVLFDNGFVGVSYGEIDRVNGVPGHGHSEEEHDEDEHEEGHDEDHEEELIESALQQRRFQVMGEWSFDSGVVNNISAKFAATDYTHSEVHFEGEHEHEEEEEGEADHEDEHGEGTTFDATQRQLRVTAEMAEMAGWRNAILLDVGRTTLDVDGAEAFTPKATTDTMALAMLLEKHSGSVLWQLGGRIESVDITATAIELEDHHHEDEGDMDEEELHINERYDFMPYSLSMGAVWDYTEGYNLGFSLSRSQRAPSSTELYALGPHIATGTYEVGALYELHEEDDELHLDAAAKPSMETSNNIDLTWRKFDGNVGYVVNAFYNRIDSFYYLTDTGHSSEELLGEDVHTEDEGHEEDEHDHASALPVYAFITDDVSLYGLEAQIDWQLTSALKWTQRFDSVRGRIQGGGKLERMPADRLTSIVAYQQGSWSAEAELAHYFKQTRLAENETATAAYTLVDLELAYDFEVAGGELSAFFGVHNATDEEARPHTSVLKDQAPLPGRGFKIGLRGNF